MQEEPKKPVKGTMSTRDYRKKRNLWVSAMRVWKQQQRAASA